MAAGSPFDVFPDLHRRPEIVKMRRGATHHRRHLGRASTAAARSLALWPGVPGDDERQAREDAQDASHCQSWGFQPETVAIASVGWRSNRGRRGRERCRAWFIDFQRGARRVRACIISGRPSLQD
jgi:hypothetical protein